jgi:long-chain acyl-CoA synthetase
MERRSLVEFLVDFQRRGNDCAYAERRGYRTERWSYQQIAETAFRMARELELRSIGKGDHVVLYAENSAEWAATFFGCVLRGVIVVPLDNGSSSDFAQRITQQVDARLVLCSRRHYAAMAMWPTIAMEDLRQALSQRDCSCYSGPPLGRNDTLEIVFTSGTTAEPKGVVITHGNVLANIAPLEAQIRAYLKYERLVHPIRFLSLLPLSHVFGQFMGMFLPQLMGGVVLFQDSLKPSEIVETIHRERVSVLVAVPRMLQALRGKVERELSGDGGSERFRKAFTHSEGKHFIRRWWTFRRIHCDFGWKFWAFICGGAALDRKTEEFWGRLGFAVIQGYGLTETTSLISVNHPFKLGSGSIGKVLPGRELKLAEDGEILVRGAGVSTAYVSNGEMKTVARDDGWYGTGDLGAMDAAGNLYFKGRKKEVLVTPAGMNVYPGDLEAVLRQQPEVRDCVVIGIDRDGNAEPCAVLILRERNQDPAAVVARANESLAEFQRMNCWFLWPEQDFPRTSTQKPRTNAIRERVLAGQTRPLGTVGGSGDLAELIREVAGKKPGSRISTNAAWDTDLNFSSLERVELMGAIEDRFQVDLSEVKFASAKTVRDLEEIIRGEQVERVKYHYPGWALAWPLRWLRIAAYYILIRPAVLLLGWPHIEGKENLRGVRGPVLVISNHIDDVDPGFIMSALPAHLRHHLATAAGGEALELLHSPDESTGWFGKIFNRLEWALGVALLNLFPLPRAVGFRRSFTYAGEAVDRGYSILVFPEGHHTTDGQIRPFRAGIGLLAKNLKVPIVPMRIDGLFEVKKAGRKFAWPRTIRVKIGAPIRISEVYDPQTIADALRRKVEEL